MVVNSDFRAKEYLVDSSLAEEAVECRRNGYVLTGKFLGQGAYAKVYMGQAIPDKLKNNQKLRKFASASCGDVKVAIKIISTVSAPEIYITKFLPREVATMNKCYRHANVIQLFDIFASQKRVYLVLEYAECGDLLTYVNQCYAHKSKSNCLSEDNARMMFRDILAGVHFIHSRGVAHRDLKCENVLLAKHNQAKLSDFGFAVQPRTNRDLLQTHCGSYAYAPPEILKQQKYDGKIADLWSLGVILFAMVSGGLPFKESNAKAVLGAMKKPVYFKGYLTNDCKDLIRRLLRIKPQKRITLREVYAHPWIRKNAGFQSSDEQAFGDAKPHDSSPPNYVIDSGQQESTTCDDFDNPENVLKYIRERMETFGNFRKHRSKRSTEQPITKPSKPCILENILNVDSPPETLLTKTTDKPLTIPVQKGQNSKPTIVPRRKSIYNTLNTGSAGKKQSTRLIELDEEEIIVCSVSGKTTLPKVKDFSKPNGKNPESYKTKSPFKLRYERKQSSTEDIQEGKRGKRNTNKPRQKLFHKMEDSGNERTITSPKVINININQLDTKRPTVNKISNLKSPRKTNKNSSKREQFNPTQRPGAISVPVQNFSQVRAEMTTEPVTPLIVNSPGLEPTTNLYPKEVQADDFNRQTAKYNMTCTHGFKKHSTTKTILLKPQCPARIKESSPIKKDATGGGNVWLKHKQHATKKSVLEKSPSPTKPLVAPYVMASAIPHPAQFSHVGTRTYLHQPRKSYEHKQNYVAAQLAWVDKQNSPGSTRTVNFAEYPRKRDSRSPVKSPAKDIRYSEHYDAVLRSEDISSRPMKPVSPTQGKLLTKRSQTVKNILQSLEKQRKLQNSTWFNNVTSPTMQPCTDIDSINNRHNIVLRMCNEK